MNKKLRIVSFVYTERGEDFDSFPGGAEGFFDAWEPAQIKYLMQWYSGVDEGDYFDIEIEPGENPYEVLLRKDPSRKQHNTFSSEGFIVYINPDPGCAGIERGFLVDDMSQEYTPINWEYWKKLYAVKGTLEYIQESSIAVDKDILILKGCIEIIIGLLSDMEKERKNV